MKSIVFDFKKEKFELREVPLPKIRDQEVLVKVEACGLNPVDAKIDFVRQFLPETCNHWTPGLDVSGVIAATGRAVRTWTVGDRVLYHGNLAEPHGGCAEYGVCDADMLIPHPFSLPAADAAATPCAGWTAWYAMELKLRARNADSILILGGSGGVGSYAVQLARHFKIRKIIVTTSAANQGYVRSLGATHVIDYQRESVVEQVHALTSGQGVELAFDTVGGDNDILAADALDYNGAMAVLNGAVRPERYDRPMIRGLSFHQIFLGGAYQHGEKHKRLLKQAGISFTELAANRIIHIRITKTVRLDQVPETLQEILQKRTVGKIVMVNS